MAKVCIVASYAPSLANFRGDLIRRMLGKGHSVTALAPDHDAAARVRELGCRFVPFPLERTGLDLSADRRSLQTLKEVFAGERPDVVLSYTLKPNIYASLAAAAVGVPGIYSLITGLGFAFSGRTPKQRLLRTGISLLLRRSLRSNSAVMFQNHDDQRLFRKKRITAPTQRTVVVPGSGVNLEHFAVSEPVAAPCRFLLIARLVREKGVYEYVHAAREHRERHPEAEFHLLGRIDSNPGAITREELDRWVDEGLIRYHGYQSDVRPFLEQHCSVYVLPSMYREGVPRSILEALAVGRAVLTTDAPGCRETVREDVNGFLVAPGDAEALKERMEYCITHPEQVQRMGRESRRLAEERFNVHKVNATMLETMGLSEGELSCILLS